jgi:hypothetical protein
MLWAVKNGFVGVNMTYRLAPQSPWPAAAEDVSATTPFAGVFHRPPTLEEAPILQGLLA